MHAYLGHHLEYQQWAKCVKDVSAWMFVMFVSRQVV